MLSTLVLSLIPMPLAQVAGFGNPTGVAIVVPEPDAPANAVAVIVTLMLLLVLSRGHQIRRDQRP